MVSAPPRALIKSCPEDFVVEEVPAYEPSGQGEHVFVRFTKRGLTTLEAVARLGKALGCDPREAGFAGMKDKQAVATQTVSFHAPRGIDPRDIVAKARTTAVEDITVADATPHPHKLKPGHLRANRFSIALRELDRARLPEIAAAFERIAREGVPNRFGRQRYGARGDNVARALAWLRGEERGPRDPRRMRLLWSAVQSEVFDAVLAARVADGTWTAPLAGDLLKLHESGGMFPCTDPSVDRSRAVTGELSPTGPIVGARMRWPEGDVLALERRISASVLGEGFDLDRTRRLGEGTRRALRMWARDLRFEPAPCHSMGDTGHRAPSMWVHFMLTKGAYATTVLEAAVTPEEPGSGDRGNVDPEEASEPVSDGP
ncbi:MAG: tRNA pseudouridine(13) synthase TruD [Polyangiaceae bacterium]|jgi:tRNA pseudouridine13 synthase